MGNAIAMLIVSIIAGIGVSRRSGLIVGACLAAAWLIGRAHG